MLVVVPVGVVVTVITIPPLVVTVTLFVPVTGALLVVLKAVLVEVVPARRPRFVCSARIDPVTKHKAKGIPNIRSNARHWPCTICPTLTGVASSNSIRPLLCASTKNRLACEAIPK